MTETLTTFLRDPKKVIARLRDGDVIVTRRKGKALRLSLESRAASAGEGTELAAHLLAETLEVADANKILQRALERRFPWMRFLPEDARQKFTREFVETLEACASIGNMARMTEVVHAWQSTAAVYADPKLLAELCRPLPGTKKQVPAPPKTKRQRGA